MNKNLRQRTLIRRDSFIKPDALVHNYQISFHLPAINLWKCFFELGNLQYHNPKYLWHAASASLCKYMWNMAILLLTRAQDTSWITSLYNFSKRQLFLNPIICRKTSGWNRNVIFPLSFPAADAYLNDGIWLLLFYHNQKTELAFKVTHGLSLPLVFW